MYGGYCVVATVYGRNQLKIACVKTNTSIKITKYLLVTINACGLMYRLSLFLMPLVTAALYLDRGPPAGHSVTTAMFFGTSERTFHINYKEITELLRHWSVLLKTSANSAQLC
jgi:hypothetical protein